jgi:EmrB/QacA subfamily drug resistance transporter
MYDAAPVAPRKAWTLAIASLGSLMLLLNETMVIVARPDMRAGLNASFTDLQFIFDSYVLTLVAFTLTAGALADHFGRKRMFLGGLALFTAMALASGFANDPLTLILLRAVQGVGGACMFATALALIGAQFRGAERGVGLGAWGIVFGAAIAIGPLLGGALTDGLSWRWVLFINAPVGLVVFVLAWRYLVESRDHGPWKLDLGGLVTFSSGLFLLVFALIRGNDDGWGSTLIVSFIVGGALLLALFVAIESRVEQPMVDVSLFRIPTFTGAALVVLAVTAAFFPVLLYIVQYLRTGLGYSAVEVGLQLLTFAVVASIVSPISGAVSARMTPRVPVTVGMLALAGGFALMLGFDATDRWTALIPGLVVAGIGLGIVNPPIAEAALGVVPAARGGLASGVNNTFRQAGIAVGIAAVGAIFQSNVRDEATRLLAPTPVAAQAHKIGELFANGNAAGVLQQAPPPVRATLANVARESAVHGLHQVLIASLLIAGGGALLALVLLRARDLLHRHDAVHGTAGLDVVQPSEGVA